MLDINVSIKGDRVVINNLQAFAKEIPAALDRGLERVAKGVHRKAFDFLSGKGAKKSNIGPGGYPVPVRTGHLRRSLDWLKPGESKTGEVGTFIAGRHEVVIYDSAVYADPIHEGKFGHEKFGRRPFLTDGLEKFNQGSRISKILEEEMEREIKRQGLD